MKKILVIGIIGTLLLVAIYLQLKEDSATTDPRGTAFTGSLTCAKCHSNEYSSYLHTAHFIASAAATKHSVHGSFTGNASVFYINATQKVRMEKLDSGLFQTYYVNGKFKERHRFDIVFGGVKGETYLYWQGNYLYQLPLSFFSKQQLWSTSPGLGSNFIDYGRNRSIGVRCLECHVSYIDYLPGNAKQLNGGEKFDKHTLVYSIDCERCHGPGAQHADFQMHHPEVKTARYITTYSSLTRGQKLDMCALCHSGPSTVMLRSAFAFIPGDTLSKFKFPDFSRRADTGHVDVHGNQLQLLQSSKCFINSTMDCGTCHNTHVNTRGQDAMYTKKCLDCHNSPNHVYCKLVNKLSDAILKANCIGCHMPALPTKNISVQVSNKLSLENFFVHTHHIAIYPQEVKRILEFVNK